MSRRLRVALTLVVTALAVAYILWKIDVGETVDVLLDADPWWFALSVAIMIGTTPAMALRAEVVNSLADELFLLQTMGDDRAIVETYVAGKPAKSALAVADGTPLSTVLDGGFPRLHFSRKGAVETALRNFTPQRLAAVIDQLATAALDMRKQTSLAAVIAQRTLLAIAANAKRRS